MDDGIQREEKEVEQSETVHYSQGVNSGEVKPNVVGITPFFLNVVTMASGKVLRQVLAFVEPEVQIGLVVKAPDNKIWCSVVVTYLEEMAADRRGVDGVRAFLQTYSLPLLKRISKCAESLKALNGIIHAGSDLSSLGGQHNFRYRSAQMIMNLAKGTVVCSCGILGCNPLNKVELASACHYKTTSNPELLKYLRETHWIVSIRGARSIVFYHLGPTWVAYTRLGHYRFVQEANELVDQGVNKTLHSQELGIAAFYATAIGEQSRLRRWYEIPYDEEVDSKPGGSVGKSVRGSAMSKRQKV